MYYNKYFDRIISVMKIASHLHIQITKKLVSNIENQAKLKNNFAYSVVFVNILSV